MANGFERYTKKTRRTLFLEEMEEVVPWAKLRALVESVYAKAGNGRPPVGAERMLLEVALNYSRRKVDITVAEDQNFAMSREMKEARRSLNRDLFPNDLVSPLATRDPGRGMSAKNVVESAPTLGIQYPNRGALSVP
jgi:hypothetical protein